MKRSFSIETHFFLKTGVFAAISYLFLAQIVPGVFAMWRESHTLSTLTVSPPMRARIVASLADALTRHCLDADKGAQLAAFVRQSDRQGDYEGMSSPSELARALSAGLYQAAGDSHIGVEFSAAVVPDEGGGGIDRPPDDDVSLPVWLINRLGRTLATFGVEEVTQSASGIAYIRLNTFFRPYLAAEKYAAAMDRVAGSRALIIDLRDNGGGKADSVPLLASYFFDRPTHLSDIVSPRTGERRAM